MRTVTSVIASCLVLVMLLSSLPARAGEDIVYDQDDASQWKTLPAWVRQYEQIVVDATDQATANLIFTTPFSVYPDSASGNTVTMDTENNLIALPLLAVGGQSDSGTVSDNTVRVESGTTPIAIGGAANSGNASGNSVMVGNDSVTTLVLGGVTVTGTATGNSVEFSGQTASQYGIGGVSVFGDAVGNTATARDQAFLDGGLAGGASLNGDAYDNVVTVSDTAVVPTAIGGVSITGEARANTVNIFDDATAGDATGGLSNAGDARANTVNVFGNATVDEVRGGYSSQGDALDNRVYLADYADVLEAVGGYTEDGAANGNFVNISGNATVDHLRGGYSENGDAKNNYVSVTGDARVQHVDGGYSDGGGTASGNFVLISGGTVWGTVNGGYSYSGEVSNNTVFLTGTPDLSAADLYGGFTGTGTVQNNSLVAHGFKGKILSVQEFHRYDLTLLPALNAGEAMIAPRSALMLDASIALNIGIDGRLDAMSGGHLFNAGEEIILVSNIWDSFASRDLATPGYGLAGLSWMYEYGDAYFQAMELRLPVKSRGVNPAATGIAGGRLGSQVLLNMGGYTIAYKAYDTADAFINFADGSGWSKATGFVVADGSDTRSRIASHIDVAALNLLAGVAWRNNGACGSLLVGAFFEAGYGDYDGGGAYGPISTVSNGHGRYFGGGLMGRYDWQNGLYAEASARAGGQRTSFGLDMNHGNGAIASYRINTAYYGAHAGLGYKWTLGDRTVLDASAKYFWSHQGSDSAWIMGEDVWFKSINSHRLRSGARLSYALNACVSAYAGAAYEYEFAGKGRAGTAGIHYGVPKLKGGTGIGELGVTLRRGERFTADVGVQGHVGRRDGVSGNLRLGWNF